MYPLPSRKRSRRRTRIEAAAGTIEQLKATGEQLLGDLSEAFAIIEQYAKESNWTVREGHVEDEDQGVWIGEGAGPDLAQAFVEKLKGRLEGPPSNAA